MKSSFAVTATMVFAAVLSATFAANQQATKGTLFIGPSQSLAESAICLDHQPTCLGLRKLEEEEEGEMMRGLEESNGSAALKPVNATTGKAEVVCFGPFPQRCYTWSVRRLQDVVDDHRRLEVTGDSEVKDVACFGREWGLQCN